MQLWLSRHGQTAWNLGRRYQGQGDSGLTPQGECAARCLCRRLAEAPLDIVYTSDLERAWRTAELAMAGRAIPIIRDPAWREMQYGAWEGLTRAEVKARYPDLWRQRLSDKAAMTPPGGESLLQVQERVLSALAALWRAHLQQSVLVITHSGPLYVLACWLHAVDLNQVARVQTTNCGLSAVQWESAEPILTFWDDVRHLPLVADPPSAAGSKPHGCRPKSWGITAPSR